MGKAAAVRAALNAVADGALVLILAPLCAACRRPLDHPTRSAVCDACWTRVEATSPRWATPLVTLGGAVGIYDGTLRDVIHALKYDRRPTIAPGLARLMACGCLDVLDGADAVVPVPLHRSRERSRGFNQARELARHLPLPMADVLVRTRRTESQADLPAARRHANVKKAFALGSIAQGFRGSRGTRGNRELRCGTYVLVDDVATTGATLDACADVLLRAGAREVRALTCARAVTRLP